MHRGLLLFLVASLAYAPEQKFDSYNLILRDGTYDTRKSLGRVRLNPEVYDELLSLQPSSGAKVGDILVGAIHLDMVTSNMPDPVRRLISSFGSQKRDLDPRFYRRHFINVKSCGQDLIATYVSEVNFRVESFDDAFVRLKIIYPRLQSELICEVVRGEQEPEVGRVLSGEELNEITRISRQLIPIRSLSLDGTSLFKREGDRHWQPLREVAIQLRLATGLVDNEFEALFFQHCFTLLHIYTIAAWIRFAETLSSVTNSPTLQTFAYLWIVSDQQHGVTTDYDWGGTCLIKAEPPYYQISCVSDTHYKLTGIVPYTMPNPDKLTMMELDFYTQDNQWYLHVREEPYRQLRDLLSLLPQDLLPVRLCRGSFQQHFEVERIRASSQKLRLRIYRDLYHLLRFIPITSGFGSLACWHNHLDQAYHRCYNECTSNWWSQEQVQEMEATYKLREQMQEMKKGLADIDKRREERETVSADIDKLTKKLADINKKTEEAREARSTEATTSFVGWIYNLIRDTISWFWTYCLLF